MTFEKICVVGLGYIGLPTAAVIASRGIEVIGVDVSKRVIDTINRGEVHIVEPDLDMLVQATVNIGKLRATLLAEPAQAFIIAVPTPFKEGHKPDLSYIHSAAKIIAPALEKGNLVILESTSPVGATEKLSAWLQVLRPDLSFPQTAAENADIHIAHCPERVLPGHVLEELVSNDRIVGGMSKKCSDLAIKLYKTFVRGECYTTNSRTAEMAKLTENSFRDVNIAFANELSIICDKLQINVWELIALANRHPRVNILNPGPGVGGHCIAVDPWFIVDSAPEEAILIRHAREINDAKPNYVVKQVVDAAVQFKKPVIACLGLAFKADIDDLRESPAVDIVLKLAQSNQGKILAVEPNISHLPPKLQEAGIELVSLKKALEEANILVVLVDHKPFKTLTHNDINTKVIMDTRGIFRHF
ncbi:UDP-N-acetyl-D-mannosamine dehydrogenase [uncultured Paraglaciecola sp.]|uniref:UDP-N-acetyl-D-mannosamine dehydrogenase n=1 Tax=uncultured Paraglaciecola sp. TaxID=1765024 RepID=UPI002632623A|nr:UDP-N-acetyl-D-mannosamine dehydrogenase [uncultured Paraglaciecola sp.]